MGPRRLPSAVQSGSTWRDRRHVPSHSGSRRFTAAWRALMSTRPRDHVGLVGLERVRGSRVQCAGDGASPGCARGTTGLQRQCDREAWL